MRIGTTPTHTFKLPTEMAGAAKKVRVIYNQLGSKVLAKEILEPQGDTISIKLTQEETLLFHHAHEVEVQLRVLTDDGDALTSDIYVIEPYRCLEESVFE